MHRARSIYGLAQAFNCNPISRTLISPSTPRVTCRCIGTEDDSKDGKSRPQVTGQSLSDAEQDERFDSSSGPNVQPEVKASKWKPTWPSTGSRKFSPAIAGHVLPLLEATPDDPPVLEANQPDRLTEVLAEPSQLRSRSHRNHPNRRGVLPRSFRKAILSAHVAQKEASPTWSQTRKVLPRDKRSIELLEQELQFVAHGQPHPEPIRNILRILIADRGVKVSPHHYEALILANCHPELGSIESVKSILGQIFRENVPITPAIAFAVVKVCDPNSRRSQYVSSTNKQRQVLSVHPDSLLRAYITGLMERQWISMSPGIAQLILVAMIREGQIELAQAEMDRLREKGVAIPDWVWTIFIHALCDRGDFETILQLYYTLPDQGYLLARPTLLHVLERASSVKELDLTKYIWRMYVESMHIIPDEGICMHVMRTAAHHIDLGLAESVAVVLESTTASTLSTSSNQSQDPESNGVPDASSVESNVSNLRAQTDKLTPFEYSRSTDKPGPHARSTPGQSASYILPAESGTPLNPDHCSDGATGLPSAPVQDDKVSHGTNPPAEKELSSASYTTKAAEPANSSTTTDRIAHRPRVIPLEAQSLLSSVRATPNGSTNHPLKYRLGNLFPMFREDMGLRDARFDPRLALRRRQDWWLQPVSKGRKKRMTISRSTKPRGD